MLSGSLAIFISNFILKFTIDDEQYSNYAILVTYITAITNAGLLGVEQLVVRTSNVLKDYITIEKKLFYICILLVLLMPLLTSFFMLHFYGKKFIELYLLSVIVLLAMLYFNILKLKKEFLAAQIMNNLWKFAVLAWVIVTLIGINMEIYDTLIFIMVPMIFLLSVKCSIMTNIEFKSIPLPHFFSFLAFFTSMAMMATINNSDRFIVLSLFDEGVFGSYFFALNLIIFPAAMLGTYIGFRKIVDYKTNYVFTEMISDTLKYVIYAIPFMFALLIAYKAIVYFFGASYDLYDFNLFGYISLCIIFLSRISYGCLSAAMGAIGEPKQIMRSNGLSFLYLVSFFLFLSIFELSLDSFIFGYSLIWLCRIIAFYTSLRKLRVVC